MLVTDTQGATLAGLIDGVNQDFTTSLAFDPDSLQVFINGRNKVISLDDGAIITGPQSLRTKDILLEGDTLSVTYQLAGQASLGGAPDVGQSAVMVVCDTDQAPTSTVQSPGAPTLHVCASAGLEAPTTQVFAPLVPQLSATAGAAPQ